MNINVVDVRACTKSKQAEPMQINEKDCGSGFFFFSEGRNRLSGWKTPGVTERKVAIHQRKVNNGQLLLPSARRSAALSRGWGVKELAAAHQVGCSF